MAPEKESHHRPWEARRRRRIRRRTTLAVKRSVLIGSGCVLMLAGVATVPTPVPIGFVLFVLGLYMAARGSKTAQRGVTWARRVIPPLSRGLNRLKPRLPRSVRRFVERSDPGL